MKRDYSKSAKMLFSREIESLHADEFEGSMIEHHTSIKVYFGNDGGRRSKRCFVTGVINFESDYCKDTDTSLCSNSGNSAVTSQVDPNNIQEDSTKFGTQHLSADFNMPVRNGTDVNVKRMRLSVGELSDVNPYLQKVLTSPAPLKGDVSGMSKRTSQAVSGTVACRLVESASHGVSCSSYLLKKYIEMDRGGDTGDKDKLNSKLSTLDRSNRKENISASKAIASPVSQESSATKLLVASPSTIVNEPGSHQCDKPRRKESCFMELDEAEMSLSRESTNNPRPLLRYHINQLLKAAGWTIGRRKRSNKYNGIGEYIYKSPGGRPVREFRRAWIMCGQNLFLDANYAPHESDVKQWDNLIQLWSDLYHTTSEIEEMDNLETTTALAHRWYLLDPFANLVFIDKTFGSLKVGKVVKARRNLVIDSKGILDGVPNLLNEENIRNHLVDRHVATEPSGHSLVSDSALTVYDEDSSIGQDQCGSEHLLNFGQLQQGTMKAQNGVPSSKSAEKWLCSTETVGGTATKYRKIADSERSSLDPDSTSAQIVTRLFEVPMSTKNADIFGGFENASPHEDSNISVQSPDRDRSGYKEEMPLRVIKKSKKISEIESTTLYQNDELGLSVSYKSGLLGLDEDGTSSEPRCVQKCFIANVRNVGSFEKSSLCFSQLHNEKTHSRCKKFCHISGSSKKLVCANYDKKHPNGLNFVNDTDEGSLFIKCEHLDDGNKLMKPQSQIGNRQKKSITCQLNDEDLLISAIVKNKSCKSTTKQSIARRISHKSKSLRKRNSQKGSCRLLPRSLIKSRTHYIEGKWSGFGERTVLSWLINSGAVSLNEIIQYQNPKDDTVVKDGLVTWDGILCRCCDMVFSISDFKNHSGFRLNRPCLNLFMESGKPFTLCQLEAWSAEYKARKNATRTVQVEEIDQNDDSCGLCGDGGELICCDNCPSTFHQTCLYVQELPEGSWYCSNCTCQICGEVVKDKEASKSPSAFTCSQCEHKYHETCLKEKGLNAGVASDIWFCGKSCQEVYSGLQSRVGLINHISEEFSWTLLRCIPGDQKVHSAQRFVALKAECNSKLAVALTIMEECFLPMVDPRTGINMIPHVMYNWSSEFARLNYHGFYTMVLEKNDVLMSVASIRIHGATVAEMPLIATCSKHRRQGMCRHLMNAIEQVLRSLKVEKLVISAVPILVDTWTAGFGFKPLEHDERQSLSTVNLMVFPGTVWLKKSLSENQVADQQKGSCPSSPSGTDDLTESRSFHQEENVNEPARYGGEKLCTNELNANKEVVLTDNNNILVDEDKAKDLHIEFLKLSCDETAATLGADQPEEVCHVEIHEVNNDRLCEEATANLRRNQLEEVCHVETQEMYSDRQPTSFDRTDCIANK